MKEQDYCGCCGAECFCEWCDPCEKHIDPRKKFWDATFFAQHGKHCPYQVSDKIIVSGFTLVK